MAFATPSKLITFSKDISLTMPVFWCVCVRERETFSIVLPILLITLQLWKCIIIQFLCWYEEGENLWFTYSYIKELFRFSHLGGWHTNRGSFYCIFRLCPLDIPRLGNFHQLHDQYLTVLNPLINQYLLWNLYDALIQPLFLVSIADFKPVWDNGHYLNLL